MLVGFRASPWVFPLAEWALPLAVPGLPNAHSRALIRNSLDEWPELVDVGPRMEHGFLATPDQLLSSGFKHTSAHACSTLSRGRIAQIPSNALCTDDQALLEGGDGGASLQGQHVPPPYLPRDPSIVGVD